MTASTPVLVVPCYNEENRLDVDALQALVSGGRTRLLLVDDGSTDRTADIIRDFAARSGGSARAEVMATNGGKGEAVRRGLSLALAEGAPIVGYLDADFSTPATEMLRLVEIAVAREDVSVVLGSRVRLLGTAIARRAVRHYLGRVFATAASLTLQMPVYDTQCGAKVLRRSPALEAALQQPFGSRWTFDVELIARLMAAPPGITSVTIGEFLEVPLLAWRDVGGSKLRLHEMLGAALDLARIAWVRRRQIRRLRSTRADRRGVDG